MDYGLANKVALVSGSSQGIGRAVAAALAAEGCRVVVTARNVKQLGEAAEAIRQAGGTVHAVVGDATRGEDIEQVVAETVSHFGSLHILVNNVGGVGSFAPFHELTDEDWHQRAGAQRHECRPLYPGGPAAHAAPEMGPHHQYRLRVRHPARPGNGPLQRLQGSAAGAGQEPVQGLCRRQHPGQQRLAGLYPHPPGHGHDAGAGQTERDRSGGGHCRFSAGKTPPHRAEKARGGKGGGRGGHVSGLRGGLLCQWRQLPGGRRLRGQRLNDSSRRSLSAAGAT